jgi:cellulose biosynthesis protein BcsQ
MGAAAIAARIALPRTARSYGTPVCGLAFNELGGPLVAVCGLTGGAGTSTLALLLARQAAAESSAPVLLTEADPLRPGLAVLAGCATPRPLIALARELDDDRVPGETFLELAPRLRLIAAAPQPCASPSPDALRALLGQARDAHGVTLVDCGTHWTAGDPVLAAATHIIWTVAATPTGLARAQAHLTAGAAPTEGRRREMLVAAAIVPRPLVPVRALRQLARRRCERLVLIAHDERLARGASSTSETTHRALAGLARTLRRPS